MRNQLTKQLGQFFHDFAGNEGVEARATVQIVNQRGAYSTNFQRGQFMPTEGNPISAALRKYEDTGSRTDIEAIQTQLRENLHVELDYNSDPFVEDTTRAHVHEVILLHHGQIDDILAAVK